MPASLPPFDQAALLLDLDGTVLDIAPTPDDVVVPPGTLDVLHMLRALLGDAVAIVTGRPVEKIDALLGDAVFAVAGEHGGAIRRFPGGPLERPPLPTPPAIWTDAAKRIVADYAGALFEPKAYGFAVHYRLVPAAEEPLRDQLLALLADAPDFELLAGKMIWEVRPAGIHKGKAVAALMAQAPFMQRLPVFVGDDITDEDGIAAAFTLGGVGLRVPEAFGTPAGVRAWLYDIATQGAWP